MCQSIGLIVMSLAMFFVWLFLYFRHHYVMLEIVESVESDYTRLLRSQIVILYLFITVCIMAIFLIGLTGFAMATLGD
jgi:hypothetical protein